MRLLITKILYVSLTIDITLLSKFILNFYSENLLLVRNSWTHLSLFFYHEIILLYSRNKYSNRVSVALWSMKSGIYSEISDAFYWDSGRCIVSSHVQFENWLLFPTRSFTIGPSWSQSIPLIPVGHHTYRSQSIVPQIDNHNPMHRSSSRF